MKTVLQGVVGLVLAALLLYWVFHDKDPAALASAVERASLVGLTAGALLNFGHNHFRVLRWRWLLDPVQPAVPYRPMFSAVVLGYMTTWLIPGRVGELVRPALLSVKEGVPLGPCMGTVIADRMLDGIAILILFVVGSRTAAFAPGSQALAADIQTTALVLLGVILAGLAVLVAVSAWGGGLERRLEGAWRPVRWMGRAGLALAQGISALRTPRRLFWIVLHSLLAWGTIAFGTWLGVRAAGAGIGFPAILVMLPILALGVAIPTPGGVGGYHAAMFAGLTQLFAVDANVAAGAALLMHLAIVLPVLVAGPILLYTEKVSLRDLVVAAKQVASLGSATRPEASEGLP